MEASNIVLFGGIVLGSFAISENINEKYIQNMIIDIKSTYNPVPYEEIIRLANEKDLPFIITLDALTEYPQQDISGWSAEFLLAKMLFTERVNPDNVDELRHIAATAINAAIWDNIPLARVCTDKKRYSGVMRPKNVNWVRNPHKIHLDIAKEMISLYKTGIPEIYKRSYFFCNMDIVKDINPKAYKWFLTLKKSGEFLVPGHGKHTFFTSTHFEDWISKNQDAKLVDKLL